MDNRYLNPAQCAQEKLTVFSSAVHDDMREDSDLDLLVEFKKPVGLFRLVRIENEMMSLFQAFQKSIL
ncbi:MAG: nucleotidyltransferase domain-containing protein [Methanosarcinales archaeon]|nr:nucleotidyltransferase domain-containing protein [Methanosarcinales archaeon]